MKNLLRSLLVASTLALALPACGGGSYVIRGTPRMPGVDGVIQLEDAPGTNRMVTVQLDHLAPPERLAAGHQYYALWFRRGSQVIFAGTIEYDEGSRRGRATATTPLQGFEVVVSIESRQNPEQPSGTVVIQQRVN